MMLNEPIVSVIMPAYNDADFIGAAIRSVQAQTFPCWEMRIVDDGSTDETVNAARAAADGDARVHIHRFNHSGLPAVARNRALGLARGQILAFLDADDLWKPDKLRIQIASLNRKGAGWGFANVHVIGDDPVQPAGLLYRPGWMPPRPFMPALLTGNGIPCITVIVRRELLKRVAAGGDASQVFDESRELSAVEDWDLALRLAQLMEPDYIPDSLASYRGHSRGISRQHDTSHLQAMAIIRKYRDLGVPMTLLQRAMRFHAAKCAIKGMLSGTVSWRRNLLVACLRLPCTVRELCLASLALFPGALARRMYLCALTLKRRQGTRST